MKALSYNIPFVAGKTFKLALFSDLHLDSPDCDIETLKTHLDICKKEGRYSPRLIQHALGNASYRDA